MAQCDIFVILSYCQFEKNNFQNRYLLNEKEKWITKSVKSGNNLIVEKEYTDGNHLFSLNMLWINVIRKTLNINTRIEFDYPTKLTKTERLVDLIKHYCGSIYVTNPSAKDKYLDEKLIWDNGIGIEYCHVPKELQIHTFEAFEKFGIDGCIKQLKRARELAIA